MVTNKYNILINSGKWGAKSTEEEKIVALSSELNNLKCKLKLSTTLEATAVRGGGGNKKANNASNSNSGTGGENSGKQKNEKNKKDHRRKSKKEA